MPADIRDRILAVQEKSGVIPNVFLALAHRAGSCAAAKDRDTGSVVGKP